MMKLDEQIEISLWALAPMAASAPLPEGAYDKGIRGVVKLLNRLSPMMRGACNNRIDQVMGPSGQSPMSAH